MIVMRRFRRAITKALTSQIGQMVDGWNLPAHPFEPVAPEASQGIPLMIGTTATELTVFEELVGGPTGGLEWDGVEYRVSLLVPLGECYLTCDYEPRSIQAKSRQLAQALP